MSGELIGALIGGIVAGAAGIAVIWFAAAALSGNTERFPQASGRIRGVLGVAPRDAAVTSGTGRSDPAEAGQDRSDEAWYAMCSASAPFTLTAGIGLLIAALIAPFLGSAMAAGNVILGGTAWLVFWIAGGLARGSRAAKDARPIRR